MMPSDLSTPSTAQRALFTTSSLSAGEVADRCGDDCYSYFFVQRAFLPLLQRWGSVEEVSQSPARVHEAVAAARDAGQTAVHISFLPLQYLQLTEGAANVAFPFWEYPDIPSYDVAGNPRNNWLRMADCLDLILTACEFTRDSFVRAGVKTPLEVVSVPIADDYFRVPPWEPRQRVVLDCPCYVLPQAVPAPRLGQIARRAAQRAGVKVREQCRIAYRRGVRPLLPKALHRRLASRSHAMIGKEPPPVTLTAADLFPIPFATSDRIDLSGVVYSTILNPFDIRKNWRGIIDAFLRALGDEDATLVVKLAVSQRMRQEALHNVLHFYRRLRIRHRAKVVIVGAYLSDEQMIEIARASTYYLNASHAEGACLPLQDALAAGRPGIAPAHTAMAEYVDDRVAFVVPSHAERTHWQWDPTQRRGTTWQTVRRRDLVEQLRLSYEAVRRDPTRYQSMAECGRQRMSDLASAEQVWRRLSSALDSVHAAPALAAACARLQATPVPSRKAA
ncbi:MAG TPA: glycosyltransferase [Pirellulales bacterium]|nr:glycosyltransferase [Pirellulales bacterium]